MSQRSYKIDKVYQFLPQNYKQVLEKKLGRTMLWNLKQLQIASSTIFLNLALFEKLKKDSNNDYERLSELIVEQALGSELQLQAGVPRRRIVCDVLLENLAEIRLRSPRAKVLILTFDRAVRVYGDFSTTDVEVLEVEAALESLEQCMAFGAKAASRLKLQGLQDSFPQLEKGLQAL